MHVAPVAFHWCKDLSTSLDQKLMMLLSPMEKCLMDFYQGVFFLPKFVNSSPKRLKNGDKDICQSQ